MIRPHNHAKRRRYRSPVVPAPRWLFALALGIGLLWNLTAPARTSDAEEFHKTVQPILAEYCYDCHGDGMDKGGMALDKFKNDDELLADRELWWNVLKYVRAGIMPPHKKEQPTAKDRDRIGEWVKSAVFRYDPEHPDPGRVTIRRLNRVEYRNTIRDLMGYDFKVDEEFPPDDTGYGFDNIGDVLTVSPLLLEKYVQAAETIVAASVPAVSREIPKQVFYGNDFRKSEGRGRGDEMNFYKEAAVSRSCSVETPGRYRLLVDISVHGSFDFDPGKCDFGLKADDKELFKKEFGWNDNKKYHFEFPLDWQPGKHELEFNLHPLTPEEKRETSVGMRISSVTLEGPEDRKYWGRPKNFEKFFTRDAPRDAAGSQKYAREVLERFATKAFRRPVDARTLDRLTAFAGQYYKQPGKSFEEGIAHAMVAVLASPRFLFRTEENAPGSTGGPYALIDEYSLATRLSYFLWSTMPDDELIGLAARGELRKNLPSQAKRMLEDSRSESFIRNFTGQWLEARDVDNVSIDERLVLARDRGDEKELQKEVEEFRARQAARRAQTNREPGEFRRRSQLPRLFAKPEVELDGNLRRAMREETQMFFGSIVHGDGSVLDLLDSDYTYLNERLARLYGIDGVTGDEMRKVKLPADSPRGGVLTEGTVLTVTSNPTRTSPVKRGLFILDNVLGIPPPPPPPDIPQLEAAEKMFKDHEPTLKEILAVHRDKPLCSSCHSRMDPLGLALEQFNALGMYREKERGQSIECGGTLITGESFKDIQELKHILKDNHKLDFYRCLTEKLMTYALGRGLEYYDVGTVDKIVADVDKENGKFSAMLMGIVESAAFQQRRAGIGSAPTRTESQTGGNRLAQIKTTP